VLFFSKSARFSIQSNMTKSNAAGTVNRTKTQIVMRERNICITTPQRPF
jgi:hypothetical protein